MTSKPKTYRIRKILDALKKAASGDYSSALTFKSQDDELGLIADSVNTMLKNTAQRFAEIKQDADGRREDATRYRNILDSIQESYYEVDLKGNLLFFNDAVVQELGYTKEDLRGINFHQLADKANTQKIYKIFHKVFLTGQSVKSFDWKILKKNKEKMDVEASVALMHDEKGKPAGFRGVVRVIAQRKQAERDLRQSEEKYRTILDIMGEGYVEHDLSGRITFVNDTACRLMGYTREKLISMHYHDYLTPETVKKMYDIFHGVYMTGKPELLVDYDILRRDGTVKTYQMNIALRNDFSGKPCGFRVLTRDMTELKQAEETVKESEKRYRMIVENMHESISLIDLNFQFIYQSPSEIRLTGYTPEEIMSIPMENQLTPESYKLVKKAFEERMAMEFSGESVDPHLTTTLEVEAYHKNGGTIWEEMNANFQRDENGKPIGIIFTSRDTTARKRVQKALQESEQRYRMIVENMHEVILAADLNLRFTYVSPSSQWLVGYAPEEIKRIPINEIVTPDSFRLAQNTVAEELAREFSGEPVDLFRSRTIELELYHKKGGTIWLEITATFTRDENSKPFGILMAGRDITARKKAEEEKIKLEAQLVQAQKMEIVGRLAGGVAHDFNNMLSVILGYVDLAKLRLAKQHPVLKDIAEIEKAAMRSRDITTQLLAFSRKQVIAPKIIDLNDLVLHSQKALMRLIGENIELKVILNKDLWAIMFDPSQIEQILINLAVNARDAMSDKGKLTIETRNIIVDDHYCESHVGLTPGDYVILSVSDNGVGIDNEILQHVFEPFFTTKEVGKGTGLGLATVYGIVKQNNGFISVYSERSHGTTFTIYMPRTTKEREVEKKDEEEPDFTGTGNILLVEDDPMVLQIAKGMLESIGYAVTVSENPLDAISLCENPDTPIDLVITDVVMPGMSGKELRNKLVAIRPDIKVLFMSGYTSDVIANHGILEQGVQFIQKPFTIKSLACKVSEVISAKSP